MNVAWTLRRTRVAPILPHTSISHDPSAPSADRESRQEFLLHYYDSTRAEIIQRIETRDVALTLFLGAFAIILGVAVQFDVRVLYLVPILGLGASQLRTNHIRAIYRATEYLCTQYREEVAA